jgi:antitoxin component of MazEF toxin-antitoxin module
MIFDLGQRKIQKLGYSYMIPIPTSWIRDMNIGKGDTLNIKMTEDKSLKIKPSQGDNGCLANPEKYT